MFSNRLWNANTSLLPLTKWTARPHYWLQGAQTYRCPTNTSHRTRSSCSCKTCPRVLQRNNSPPYFLSCVLLLLLSRRITFAAHHVITTKRDIAFVEYFDEGSAMVAKDALHNYKLDGENKIKVREYQSALTHLSADHTEFCADNVRTEVRRESRS
jgi:hypothetical protein